MAYDIRVHCSYAVISLPSKNPGSIEGGFVVLIFQVRAIFWWIVQKGKSQRSFGAIQKKSIISVDETPLGNPAEVFFIPTLMEKNQEFFEGLG